MKVIKFYGVRTKEKQRLMLYFGKILSVEAYVTLVTEGSFIQRTMSRIYYNDQFLITDQWDEGLVEPEYLLVDCTDQQSENVLWQESMSEVFFSGVSRSEVERNDLIVSRLEEGFITVLGGLLYDSKINEAYLAKRYKINRKHQMVLSMYLNERDEAIHLDNEYSETLGVKGLSKDYIGVIVVLLKQSVDVSEKLIKSWVKKAARRG